QVEILNPDAHIAELTDKNAKLEIELTVDMGLGYVPKEVLQRERAEIGAIVLDATFTPIRRAHYEVENMRVGDKTNFNRVRLTIETDGTLTPREALERSIAIMIQQLKAIVGFKEDEPALASDNGPTAEEASEDAMKTRVEDLELSTRTANALTGASIRTVGGLVRKTEADILGIEGVGEKAVDEIKDSLKRYGLGLRKED
ncbi:MAG: DNA-directed RNA polymerase subunit alpha C-terminal domain-containing protein, partial [Patescibacteria group bacterium]